eukprot:4982262-Prymnesium_polylepis.1
MPRTTEARLREWGLTGLGDTELSMHPCTMLSDQVCNRLALAVAVSVGAQGSVSMAGCREQACEM